ncbi:Ubiquitin-protein ligase [Podochytrium sp. JEL0797]|nr:Ubiquitin-protein ligase [Podochytrium sp. JEL0797]
MRHPQNPLAENDEDPMDLDVNQVKAGSPKPKKSRAKKASALPVLAASSKRPSSRANSRRSEFDDEVDDAEEGGDLFGGARGGGAFDDDEDDEDDEGERRPEDMEEFMNALMTAAGGGAGGADMPATRTAFFNAMFGAGAGGAPRGLGVGSGGPSSASGRFAEMLKLLNGKDQSVQLIALQELAEELSVATEDMFMGYGRAGSMQGFSTQEFTTALIKLLNPAPMDDAAFAQSFAMEGDDDDFGGFGGGGGGGTMGSEVMILACRCLSNLIEANPGASSVVVHGGGIGVLIEKLQEIEYIELAEVVLQVLDKLCIEHPYSIVKENGLLACLQYLDFFSLHVQRTAVSIVAKSCSKGLGVLTPGAERTKDTFAKLQDIVPILENLLTNGDAKIAQSAVQSLESILNWCAKDEKTLETLVTPSLVTAVMNVVRPSAAVGTPMVVGSVGGTPPVSGNVAGGGGAGVFTQLIRVLVVICKGSTKLSVELLSPEYGLPECIFGFLTGGGAVPVNALAQQHQGVESGVLASMVMNSIVSRGADQIVQVLVLACELFPALPKTGNVWCMKLGEGAGADEMEVDTQAASAKKVEALATSSGTAPIPTRSLRSAGHPSAPAFTAFGSHSVDSLATESFDTRRRNLMDSNVTSKRHLQQYAERILPILIEVFSTSVHPQIRRLSVESIAKCVWFIQDGAVLCKGLLEAKGFGKFVYELLGLRGVAFRPHPAAVVLGDGGQVMNVSRGAISVRDRDQAEAIVFVSAGVQLTSVVVGKCGARIVGWLIREGILSEMRKCVEELEGCVDVKGKKKVEEVEVAAEAAPEASGRVLRSAAVSAKKDAKGKAVATSAGAQSGESSGGFLEGMKMALERMTGGGATPSAGGDSATQRPAAVSMVTGLNHEKYVEDDVKRWLLQFATGFLQDLGENKALHAASPSSSFDVLGDLKKVSGALKKGRQPQAPSAPSKESSNQESAVAPVLVDDLMVMELQRIAQHFAGVLNKEDANNVGVTGFEVLESGIIDALTVYLTSPGVGEVLEGDSFAGKSVHQTALMDRLRSFLHVFMDGQKPVLAGPSDASLYVPGAFKNCVLRLQECLSRVEDFQLSVAVPSVSTSGSSESSFMSMFGSLISGGSQTASLREQSSPALQLTRQIRIRLVSEDPDTVPQQFRNAVISIHAVATFKTLEDFLKGKVGGLGSASGAIVGGDSENFDGDEEEVVIGEDDDGEEGDQYGDEDGDGEDEELNVLQDMMETEEENGMHESSAGDVDLITAASPKRRTGSPTKSSSSRPVSPTKSSSSAADSKPVNPAAGSSSSAAAASAPVSYAGAATTSQNAFEITFKLGDESMRTDSTIFGALYRHEQSKSESSTSAVNIWNKTFTLKYKKAAKSNTPATAEPEPIAPSSSVCSLDESGVIKTPFDLQLSPAFKKDSMTAKILFLLRVLFALNERWSEVYEEHVPVTGPVAGVAKAADGAAIQPPTAHSSSILSPLSVTAFLNNKITAKLNRQLNEPLIVASLVLPKWCNAVACDFSFLVPFETRVNYLQSTAFGYARSIGRWRKNEPASAASSRSANPLESAMLGGRVQRQKVRVSRARLIDSMVKVMDLYALSPHLIEVEFFDEVGTGLGPTLEFYSCVCKELRKREGVSLAVAAGVSGGKLGKVVMWRENGSSGDYLNSSEGLFPAPMDEKMLGSEDGRARVSLFKSMGSFVAKALLDSRIVDMPFSTLLLDMAVGDRFSSFPKEGCASYLHLIKLIDVNLHSSLSDVFKFAKLKAAITSDASLSAAEKTTRLSDLRVKDARLEDLCLDFTLPGYPSIQLKPDGSDIAITLDNVAEYIEAVVNMTVGAGIRKQVDAFKKGFNLVFPIVKLKCFGVDELCLLMGGSQDEDWSYATIIDSIKADHGYTLDSKPVQFLAEMMENFTLLERREFLLFVTGSPKLPIGGFKGLTPALTVVRKNADFGLKADSYLPSVMTCVNYLKVPAYSDLEVTTERFGIAMKEGQGSFHLS